ncbi:hypothetical protein RhiirC2_801710 [Rhizophagus irregularis]|uniref:Uncharacterized protein n=1 Tax=Rhizophagus irregularis TaxID=588596 RepID=A0A2N1M242_9GLOM|nr:hypothetical protein RhiirC2_801710 [Rhizophagus irregularis]
MPKPCLDIKFINDFNKAKDFSLSFPLFIIIIIMKMYVGKTMVLNGRIIL